MDAVFIIMTILVLVGVGYLFGGLSRENDIKRAQERAWRAGYYQCDEDKRHGKITPNPHNWPRHAGR